MAEPSYTLIVVPHAKARFRKIQIPVKLAKRALVCVGIVALGLAGILTHYTVMTFRAFEARRLRAENETLIARTLEYQKSTQALQQRIAQLQGVVMKLGVMAGVEKALPDAGVGGVGGAMSPETIAPPADIGRSLQAMDRQVASLNERSSSLEEYYRDQRVQLASTPSVWPVRGYLSTSFGNRLDPFTGQPDFHSGIDISTPTGTPIVSPADGTVVFTGVKGSYGNCVVVNHGYGTVTQYGHLEGFAVKAGQRIRRGQPLGYVGNTGRSTGPHLHYEVWVHDQAQNPLQYILDEYRNLG